jgi:hypothetical protein
VAGGAESGNDGEVTAVIGKEQHRPFSRVRRIFLDEDNPFVRERVSRVAHCCVNVGAHQVRICLE